MAGERDVRIRFSGEAKALKGTAGEVRSLFAGMIDDANDMRLAGDKLGDAMKQAADKAAAELKDLQSTVEVVADALGPEMVAALDQSGRGVEDYVLEWKKLGLTYDDIKLSSTQLADGLKTLDANTRSSTDAVGTGLQKVAREGDNSRSVLANMVGNSVQDLGALGGVAGSAGVALGQLAEYASEGNISLGGFAKVAGPMAGVGLAVWALSSAMEANAKQQQFLVDQTKNFQQVLADAREQNHSTTSGIVADWEQAGRIEAQISNATATMVEFGKATDDMAKIHELKFPTAEKRTVDFGLEIDKLGMKADAFAQLIQQPVDKIQEWGAAMVASGADAGQVNLVMQGAVALHERLAAAAATDAVNARIFGQALEDAASSGNTYLATMANVAKVEDDINRSRLDAINTQLSLESAYRSTVDSLGQLGATMKDSEASAYDQANATLSAKQAVASYVQQVGGVPATKLTEILALIDQGNFQAVLQALNALAKPRVVPFDVKLGVSVSGGNSPSGTLAPSTASSIGSQIVSDINQAIAAAASKPSGGSGGSAVAGAVAKKTKEDLMREVDALKDAQFETGDLSLAAYQKHLQQRLKDYKKYSADYMRVWRELQDLNEQDAQAAKKSRDEINKNKFDLGVMSLANYKKYLESRLKEYVKYTSEWRRIYDEIQALADADKSKVNNGPVIPLNGNGASVVLSAGEATALAQSYQAANPGQPIIVNLQVNDQTVQQITIRQQQLAGGSK